MPPEAMLPIPSGLYISLLSKCTLLCDDMGRWATEEEEREERKQENYVL